MWYDASAGYCHEHPLEFALASESDFLQAVADMVEAFKHFVEENGGWQLLWNDNKTAKPEKASQLLFYGVVKNYCIANNIDVSPETDVGRGPVDFKVSRGHQLRVLVETKLANNTRFRHGLKRQVPTYLNAERVRDGYYVVIAYGDKDLDRLSDIQDVVAKVNSEAGVRILVRTVDASRHKPPASTA